MSSVSQDIRRLHAQSRSALTRFSWEKYRLLRYVSPATVFFALFSSFTVEWARLYSYIVHADLSTPHNTSHILADMTPGSSTYSMDLQKKLERFISGIRQESWYLAASQQVSIDFTP